MENNFLALDSGDRWLVDNKGRLVTADGQRLVGGNTPLLLTGAHRGQFVQDSALPRVRDLEFVFEKVLEAIVRPHKWQGLLVEHNIPEWATSATYTLVEATGDIVPMAQVSHRHDLPDAEVSRTNVSFGTIHFANKWTTEDKELLVAARLQQPVSPKKAVAQARAWNELNDRITAGGYTNGPLVLPGIANQPDVASVTSAGAWASATYITILNELTAMADAIENNSKEYNTGDTLILPLLLVQIMHRTRNVADTNETVAMTFMREWAARAGRPVRLLSWDRFATLGPGSTRRGVMFDSSDPDGLIRLMSKPYGIDHVEREPYMTTTFASGSCGGVVANNPASTVYLDGA